MRADRTVACVPELDSDRLIRRIEEVACPGWQTQIEIRPCKSLSRSERRKLGRGVDSGYTDKISRDWNEGGLSRIFVEKSIGIDVEALTKEGVRVRACSTETIYREILEELMRRRLHWSAHSESEWDKSAIRFVHPVEWRRQFDGLGYGWIGEGLLKQLRVVSDAELRSGLLLGAEDFTGLRVGHAYIKDDEPGSSWINIKDLLEHTYTKDSNSLVLEIDLSESEPKEIAGLDILYIYEDGLWSGVELVKRLKAISQWLSVKNRDFRVVFRYGVTCDAGLYAGRHFVRRERLTSVQVLPGAVAHYLFLQNGSVDQIAIEINADDETIRKGLDSRVAPYAFQENNVWNGRASEAMQVCRHIGEQLVKPWLARAKGPTNLEARAAKWALGAFGFSSMTTFSKCVPKPVLPLLWLDGDISLNGTRMKWRPLFWDARRTGQAPSRAN